MNIHPTAIVKDGAQLDPSVEVGPYAIIGENAVIGEDAVVGAMPDGSENWGITVVGPNTDVPAGYQLAANHMLGKNKKEVSR